MRFRITHLLLFFCLPAVLPADPVKEVLAGLDAASGSFQGVKAVIERESLTAILNDVTVETGTMWMSREGDDAKSVRMRIDFEEPDEKSVAFHGKSAEIYYPKIKTVHVYDLGKHKNLVESFLLLGFGTGGKALAKDFRISWLGEEEVEGVATAKLELTPKSNKAREKLVKVVLWISRERSYPVRQKFFWPSDDTTTITYTSVELNPELSDGDLALSLPSGVKREYPQR